MKTTSIFQNVVRIAGTILLISGVIFWTGNAEALVLGHIMLGSILTLALFALAYQAYRAKVSRLGLTISQAAFERQTYRHYWRQHR